MDFGLKKSEFTNLLTYHTDLINSIENGVQIDSVYTDFSKAFDKVNHYLLIILLQRFGLHSNFLNWLTSYLMDRCQLVKLSNSLSKVIFVSSRVPQGSHLGPLLFNLFINDLPSVLDSSVNVLMFADDTKFYSTIKNQDDTLNLQANLNKFSFWCEQNKLPININKCNAISFTKKKYPIIFNYQINNININRVE